MDEDFRLDFSQVDEDDDGFITPTEDPYPDDEFTLESWRTLDTAFAVPEPLSDRRLLAPPLDLRSAPRYDADDDACLTSGGRKFEFELDDEVVVTEEQESAILREIRAEITDMVKLEMTDELSALMPLQSQSNQSESLTHKSPASINRHADSDDSARLKAAILRMRQLDLVLARKLREEAEVKRQGAVEHQRMCAELDELLHGGGGAGGVAGGWGGARGGSRAVSREERRNIETFLALGAPQSRCGNEGMPSNDDDVSGSGFDKREVTPIFSTQPLEREKSSKDNSGSQNVNASNSISTGKHPHSRYANSSVPYSRQNSASSEGTSVCFGGEVAQNRGARRGGAVPGRGRGGKNFVERNKRLAADSNSAVPMTEEEKKRVAELLCDLDSLREQEEEEEKRESPSKNGEANITALVTPDVFGFRISGTERKLMEEIEGKLKSLKGSHSGNLKPASIQNFSSDVLESGDDYRARLKEVDDRLSRLDDPREGAESAAANERLRELLDECSRSASRALEGGAMGENFREGGAMGENFREGVDSRVAWLSGNEGRNDIRRENGSVFDGKHLMGVVAHGLHSSNTDGNVNCNESNAGCGEKSNSVGVVNTDDWRVSIKWKGGVNHQAVNCAHRQPNNDDASEKKTRGNHMSEHRPDRLLVAERRAVTCIGLPGQSVSVPPGDATGLVLRSNSTGVVKRTAADTISRSLDDSDACAGGHRGCKPFLPSIDLTGTLKRRRSIHLATPLDTVLTNHRQMSFSNDSPLEQLSNKQGQACDSVVSSKRLDKSTLLDPIVTNHGQSLRLKEALMLTGHRERPRLDNDPSIVVLSNGRRPPPAVTAWNNLGVDGVILASLSRSSTFLNDGKN